MMENQNMHINELVDKLKNGESTAPAAVWDRIDATLNQGRKKRALYLWSFGMAITILIAGTSALLWLDGYEKPTTASLSSSEKTNNLLENIAPSKQRPEITKENSQLKNDKNNQKFNAFDQNTPVLKTRSNQYLNNVKSNADKAKSEELNKNYTPSPEELANQEKFAHSKVQPIAALLPIKESEMQAIENNVVPISGEFTQEQLNKEYRLFSIYAGIGVFDQNLIMANPHADTVSFRAEKGHQFNVGIQYNLSKNWALDFNFGLSSNNWSSAARLIVEQETASAGLDPHVYMSTNFQFNEITNQNDVQEILSENPAQEEIRLVHEMKYTHYRLGFTYAINDFKHWDIRPLLQAEYMQLRGVSTFFQAGNHSISYPVGGFKKGIWALRPGINIAYKLSDSFSVYTEGSTSVRGTYLMKHPNWKIYENQFGLFGGIRYTW